MAAEPSETVWGQKLPSLATPSEHPHVSILMSCKSMEASPGSSHLSTMMEPCTCEHNSAHKAPSGAFGGRSLSCLFPHIHGSLGWPPAQRLSHSEYRPHFVHTFNRGRHNIELGRVGRHCLGLLAASSGRARARGHTGASTMNSIDFFMFCFITPIVTSTAKVYWILI